MRERRNAAGAPDETDRLLERDFVVADISRPVFAEKAAERLGFMLRDLTGLDQHFRDVRSAHGAMARAWRRPHRHRSRGRASKLPTHFVDALHTALARFGRKTRSARLPMLVNEEPEDMHGNGAKLRAHLDTGHDLEAEPIGLTPGFGDTLDRVVIRDGQRLQLLSFLPIAHQLRRRKLSIRRRGVRVEIVETRVFPSYPLRSFKK